MVTLAEDEQLVWTGKRAWSYMLGSLFLMLILFAAGGYLLTDAKLQPAGIIVLALSFVVAIRVWLNRLMWRYTVTTQRAVVERGIVSRHVSEIELVNVRDVQLRQSAVERLFGVGTLELSSAGRDSAEVIFPGIAAPDAVKEYIRKGVRSVGGGPQGKL